MENKNLTRFGRFRNACRGALWLIRATGLRNSVGDLQQNFQQQHSKLSDITSKIAEIAKEQRRSKSLEAWRNSRDLRAFEKKVISQNGEDGIIQEIFNRIGVETKFFVEFGVEWGEECNCGRLVVYENWGGLFIEANTEHFEKLKQRYSQYQKVRCANKFVTPANIEAILEANGVPRDLDLLSIDIDGNDYWIWAAINQWRPRLVVVEYNSTFPPHQKWVMKEDLNHRWDQTNYFGASLASLAILGRKKGYTLVATDSWGVNAFFVRDDLVADDRFLDPAVHYHYSPLNHFCPNGLPVKSGPYLEI